VSRTLALFAIAVLSLAAGCGEDADITASPSALTIAYGSAPARPIAAWGSCWMRGQGDGGVGECITPGRDPSCAAGSPAPELPPSSGGDSPEGSLDYEFRQARVAVLRLRDGAVDDPAASGEFRESRSDTHDGRTRAFPLGPLERGDLLTVNVEAAQGSVTYVACVR
jgi:hypothetical protein